MGVNGVTGERSCLLVLRYLLRIVGELLYLYGNTVQLLIKKSSRASKEPYFTVIAEAKQEKMRNIGQLTVCMKL